MRLKWKHAKALGIAAACIVAAGSAYGHAKAVDLEANKSLAIVSASDEEYQKDIDSMTGDKAIIYDVYQIAGTIADEKYDTFSYKLAEGVTFTNSEDGTEYDISTYEGLGKLKASSYDDIAQQAAAKVIEELGAEKQTFTKQEKLTEMPAGLYLVIAHGDMDPYYEEVNGKLVTYYESNDYKYSFTPVLVSLPSTGDVDGTALSTAGTWKNDVTIKLKPERVDRLEGITITKHIDKWENSSPVTFIFEVKATKNGEVKYSNVVSLTFDENSSDTLSVSLKNCIPVGSRVEVTEVYSGAGYAMTEGETGERVIEVLTAQPNHDPYVIPDPFNNKYDKNGTNGFGIENHFTANINEETGASRWDADNTLAWRNEEE